MARLNDVLVNVSQPEMFVTFAAVRQTTAGPLQVLVAGHLPVLHYHAATRTVNEVTSGQILLGFSEARSFDAVEIEGQPGDLLVLLTDGITEVFDRDDRELGLDGVSVLLARYGDEPLPSVCHRLLGAAKAHGGQNDDQSLILIRIGSSRSV